MWDKTGVEVDGTVCEESIAGAGLGMNVVHGVVVDLIAACEGRLGIGVKEAFREFVDESVHGLKTLVFVRRAENFERDNSR